jgi:hypothetical protein
MDNEQITALVARLKMAHRHGALDYGDLFEMCEEAAETIEALRNRLEWQPMETAPHVMDDIIVLWRYADNATYFLGSACSAECEHGDMGVFNGWRYVE